MRRWGSLGGTVLLILSDVRNRVNVYSGALSCRPAPAVFGDRRQDAHESPSTCHALSFGPPLRPASRTSRMHAVRSRIAGYGDTRFGRAYCRNDSAVRVVLLRFANCEETQGEDALRRGS